MYDIREYIQKITFKENLSLKELSAALGYKSRTTLDRILKEDATPAAIRKLEQALIDTFSLTADEKAALHEAAQITIYGAEKYLVSKKMWDFVQGIPPAQTERLCIKDARNGSEIDLPRRYAASSHVQAIVINCQYIVGLFSIMKALLQRGNTAVDHYMYVDKDSVRTVSAVNLLMTIFYERGYSGYVRHRAYQQGTSLDCGLNEADVAAITWLDANGKSETDLIWFTSPESGTLLEVDGLSESFFKQVGLDKQDYTPIKRTYFEYSAFSNYIKYSEDYAALERNRAIWKIKPDIGVDQIPGHILRDAVLGGDMPHDDQFLEVLSALEEVYKKRYKNTYAKRKHAFTIYKRGAMRRFALTGTTSDHFWGMRPYTLTERIVILSDLLKQQNENPYVHSYFLKDDATLRDVEIAYYEDEGMLILESDTDYNLEQGHSEIMVTHQEMLNLYREFFMNVLIQDYVYPESETCKFLRTLIEEVQRLDK